MKEGEERSAYISCSSICKTIKEKVVNYVYLGKNLIAPIDLDIHIHHENLENWQQKKEFIQANSNEDEKIIILSPQTIVLNNRFSYFGKLERNSFFDFNMSTNYCCISYKILDDLEIQDNKYICYSDFYIKENNSSEVGFFHHIESKTIYQDDFLRAANYDFVSFNFESTQIGFYKIFSKSFF